MPEYTFNPEHKGHTLKRNQTLYRKGDSITMPEEDAAKIAMSFGYDDVFLPVGAELSEDDPPPRLGGRLVTLPDLVLGMKVRQLHKLVRDVYDGRVKTRGLSKARSLEYLRTADPHELLAALNALE